MAEERARIAAKGWLTRAAAKLEAMLLREDVRSVEWHLEAVIAESEFMRRLEAFDAAQVAVEAVVDEDKLLEDVEKSSVYRESFSVLRARFRKAVSVDPEPVGSSVTHAQMKLPKLKLPTFEGDVKGWPMFWESFCACVVVFVVRLN